MDPSLIHRLFYPQVPLVMAAKYGGRVSAMPVVSYASVSDEPPLVAVACNPEGFTCKLAVKSGAFSLSVLDSRTRDAMALLASTSGDKTRDKLEDAGLKHKAGRMVNVPVLELAFATLECSLDSKRRTGDHMLLVGRVRAAHSVESFTGFWDFSKYEPILYTGWKKGLTTFPD